MNMCKTVILGIESVCALLHTIGLSLVILPISNQKLQLPQACACPSVVELKAEM